MTALLLFILFSMNGDIITEKYIRIPKERVIEFIDEHLSEFDEDLNNFTDMTDDFLNEEILD